MSATQALSNLAVAAQAAAALISTVVPEEKHGLKLSNGERVLDYARPGTKKCAIIFPSNGGAGNCPWRIQELEPDSMTESFLRSKGAWN